MHGRAILKKLKISRCAVQEILQKYAETGPVKDRPRSGRPRGTSCREHHLLYRQSFKPEGNISVAEKRPAGRLGLSEINKYSQEKTEYGLRGCAAAKKTS